MSQYNLRAYRRLPWVRFVFWFRIAFSVFLAIASAWIVYGIYHQTIDATLSFLNLIGFVLILLILGLFVFVMVAMRPPAVELAIGESGVRLEFERGSPDIRPWSEVRTRFRGRYTGGVSDSISHGQPLWSVYGRFGALSEAFIPKPAFDELISVSKAHGLELNEKSGRPGWTLYSLDRREGQSRDGR